MKFATSSTATGAKFNALPFRPLGNLPEGVIGYAGPERPQAEIVDFEEPNRLPSSVLENEKKEFVGYLTARFGVDPEVAGNAYDQLSPSFNRKASTRPPELAPELFAERDYKSEKADEFLRRIYGQWLGERPTLFQPALRRLDKALMQALVNVFRGRSEDLSNCIPSKSVEVDARLGEGAESLKPDERKRLLDRHYNLING